MFSYSHPLLTQGAGRIKTDPLNQQRIEMALNRFEQWSKKYNFSNLKYNVTQSQAERSAFIFPFAGFAFGILASQTFVHPNSRYIGKLFTILTTAFGYGVHLHYMQSYNCSRRFGNFSQYPSQIRRMIDNNDSRYAFRWFGDNYLEIIPEGFKTEEPAVDEEQ